MCVIVCCWFVVVVVGLQGLFVVLLCVCMLCVYAFVVLCAFAKAAQYVFSLAIVNALAHAR